eukprot:2091494-Rhodomonas_salina.2
MATWNSPSYTSPFGNVNLPFLVQEHEALEPRERAFLGTRIPSVTTRHGGGPRQPRTWRSTGVRQ